MDGFECEKIKTEVEELFHAVADNLKCEESNAADTKPEISSENYEFRRPDDDTKYSTVFTQLTKYIPLPLLCRLCAIPNNNTVDIFGFDATGKNIMSMINHYLPIMVKEMDTLPKQVCQSCLVELDRCHRLHHTVAEAEKQLLALTRLASGNVKELKKNWEMFPQFDIKDGTIEQDYIDETLKTPTDTEMSNDTSTSSAEIGRTEDTAVKRDVLLSNLKPCSVVLSRTEIGRKDNSVAHSNERSPNHSKRQNSYSTAGELDSGTTPASGIVQQSICDSKVTRVTRSRSGAAATQKKKTNIVDPPIPERSHTREWRYKCTRCAKMYKSQCNLTRHNKLHTGRGLHICEYCGKKFVGEADKIRHHRVHTGERPFKCSICEKKFVQLDHLKAHTVTVHAGRRDYPCSVCDESFIIAEDRTKHMLVHTNKNQTRFWQCDYCKKRRTRKEYLLKHIKICKERY